MKTLVVVAVLFTATVSIALAWTHGTPGTNFLLDGLGGYLLDGSGGKLIAQ